MIFVPNYTRRQAIGRMVMGATALATSGAFAELLTATPTQTAGPFYPNHLPLDTDNDLIILNDSLTAAVGEITHLSGRILDVQGQPLRNALVEIWQVDNNAAYIHTADRNNEKRDTHFQGFGRFLTSSTGEYYFRTIKPVAYPGRTPHIHFAVKRPGHKEFTTQCYIKGEAKNETDGVFKGATRDPQYRSLLETPFVPIPDSTAGELSATFDIILGATPQA